MVEMTLFIQRMTKINYNDYRPSFQTCYYNCIWFLMRKSQLLKDKTCGMRNLKHFTALTALDKDFPTTIAPLRLRLAQFHVVSEFVVKENRLSLSLQWDVKMVGFLISLLTEECIVTLISKQQQGNFNPLFTPLIEHF